MADLGGNPHRPNLIRFSGFLLNFDRPILTYRLLARVRYYRPLLFSIVTDQFRPLFTLSPSVQW